MLRPECLPRGVLRPECLPRGVLARVPAARRAARCAELHTYLDAWTAGVEYARRYRKREARAVMTDSEHKNKNEKREGESIRGRDRARAQT